MATEEGMAEAAARRTAVAVVSEMAVKRRKARPEHDLYGSPWRTFIFRLATKCRWLPNS